jgi:hypothetical protein
MGIDILNIQPSVISRDLKGKYICIYGPEKCGKTTFAAQMDKNLILSFEIGTNFLSGVRAQPIEKWVEFKQVLRQLEQPEAKEIYDTITIDTVGEAYSLCEKYICLQNGVQKIGEIPYGAGYTALKSEFESCLRKITMLGYGIICICHSQIKNEDAGDGNTIEHISPAMPARAAEIVNRLVDIIGYINCEWDKKGNCTRTLLTRATPTILAGSRLPYLSPKIPFGYKELVSAIGDAIEEQANKDGAVLVDNTSTGAKMEERSYEDIRAEAFELWKALIEQDEDNAARVLKKVEMIFGRKMKLSEITEDQKDLFELVCGEMKSLLK